MVVKWSACLPSILTIQVRILLKSTIVLFPLNRLKKTKKRRGMARLKEINRGLRQNFFQIKICPYNNQKDVEFKTVFLTNFTIIKHFII